MPILLKTHLTLKRLIQWIVLLLSLGVIAPLFANQESYSYQLSQSNTQYQFWTQPPSERVFKDTPPPQSTEGHLKVYAAQNEFEPLQLVITPTSNTQATINISEFGAGITTSINQVAYVPITQASDNLGQTGDYPDPLWPIEKGHSIALTAGQNTALWFTVYVPKTTPAGDYSTDITVDDQLIPVQLHVFGFALPDELHVKSQMNLSHQTILEKYGVSGTGDHYWAYVNAIKQFFIDHRLTPKNPLWSGGLTSNGGNPYINYDCAGRLSDPHGVWGFDSPAQAYLDGEGFNDGTGFPSFMAITFRNNDASQDQRPSTFCGVNRDDMDWANGITSSAYNTLWFEYIGAIEGYLQDLGYLDKSYYYLANEPQDQADYDAVAAYTQALKQAAPNLKLMVSEEPKPEIYAHPDYPGAKVDIWLPVLNNFDPTISHERQKMHNEETWVYFLYGTRPPYFNPITLDHPGIESKFTGWFLWKYRIRGIAYYAMNNWSQNPWTDPMTSNHNGDTFMFYPPSRDNQPIAYGSNQHRFVSSIRLELMRDSLEDYEYLYLLNDGSQPQVDIANPADTQADKIISGLTAYNRDSQYLYNLRRLIGQKLGGETDSIPDIEPTADHPRAEGSPGNYYINFQDPEGAPATTPLVIDNKTYLKIGWTPYDADLGYGWFGDLAHVKTHVVSGADSTLQGSVIYDDWGRQKTFEFDLPNGTYQVTVSAGWAGRRYSHNQISIEGVSFISDEATDPYLIRSREVTVTDRKLTLDMGIFDEYTMLNYLEIEAQDSSPSTPLTSPVLQLETEGNRASLEWSAVSGAKGYRLYYAPPSIETIGEVDMGLQTTFSADLWPQASFYVAIKAYNETEDSDYSNIEFFLLP